jgi:hypothetical protein
MIGRWVCSSALVATCLLALNGPADAQERPQPKLVLSQNSWDFGIVQHPRKAELLLGVTNEGTAELVITKVDSSCGCTATKIGKQVLQPRDTTQIKVVFDSKGKTGASTAKLTIKSNDPANPELTFMLNGFVRRSVQMDPAYGVGFRMLDPNENRTQTVKLTNQELAPMNPQLKPLASGKFSAELRTLQPGREYEVAITTKPPFSREAVVDKLLIDTGLEQEPTLEVVVRGEVVDRIQLYPDVIYLAPNVTEAVQRIFLVQSYGKETDFNVTAVTCDNPNVKISVGRVEPGQKGRPGQLQATKMVRVTLDLPPAAQLPATGVPIKIRTNDSEFPELTCMVTADLEQYGRLTQPKHPAAPKP